MASSAPGPATIDPARLAALRGTALLDSPAEEAFDRLTRLATRLLGVPVALVSLVDADRQFFKSCVGLPEPWASERETPLSHSLCQYAVEQAAPLVIDDARDHPLVRDNLAVRDVGIVAYAGIPLVTTDGFVLGSFCAIDQVPRHWTESDLDTLGDLAAAAMTEIELRGALRRAEDARAEADAASRAKDDFLALVSHELRSPLSAIVGNVQMIEMGIFGDVTDQQREALGRINLAQSHLIGLIEQLLDFKTISTGHLHITNVPLAIDAELQQVASMMSAHLHQAELTFDHGDTSPGIIAFADPDRLRQILVNLLSNAAKFTPTGGTVTLACDAAPAHVRVHVRDNGIGVPAERVGAVFEPFVQLRDPRARRVHGTGLGLAISRDLARAMGGDLTLTSDVGAGSTFTLTLPRVADRTA